MPAQTVVNGGPVQLGQTAVPLALGPGVTNTGQVGAFPAVWGVDVAFITSEVESGQNLDCVPPPCCPTLSCPAPCPCPCLGAPLDPIGGVVQILDLDAQILTNTTIQGLSDFQGLRRNTLTITDTGTVGDIFVAWISREDLLFNVPYLACNTTQDVNGDGDQGDWVVVMMVYKSQVAGAAPGWTWVFAPPASGGLSSGFIGVHMSGQIMVIEQAAASPLPPGIAPLPSVPPLPILALNVEGFLPLGGTPTFFPTFANAGAGYQPKANYFAGLAFPQSQFIVFEQREADLGGSLNTDGDLCDRGIAFQRITNFNYNAGPPATTSLTLTGVCLMGVGNFPSTRPHATLGTYVGFDAVLPPLQPGLGPDPPCLPSAEHSSRGRANPVTSGPCASGYSLGNSMMGERVSVAGPLFVHVVRETAPGVGDVNGDGFADDGVVVGFDQTIWPPTYRWRWVAGPGNNPAAENAFNFVINPPPPGSSYYSGLIAYEGWEAYQGLGNLNAASGDIDQGDRVIQIRLNL